MTTRGLRNNNPGNIEYGSFARLYNATGIEPDSPSTYGRGRFAVFADIVAGMRALDELLIVYSTKDDGHGGKIDTVEEALNRWAPGNENNTEAYIVAVCTVMECERDDEFDFTNPDFLFWMSAAIGEHEQGPKAFHSAVTDEQIMQAVSLALST